MPYLQLIKGQHLSSVPAIQKIGVTYTNTMQGRWLTAFFWEGLDFFIGKELQIKIRDINKKWEENIQVFFSYCT